MPIKLIAMDLDGTLLDSQSRISEENSRAISAASANGIEIVIITGRRFHSAREIIDSLPCDPHLIVNNGALIKSKAGETHQRRLLSAHTARRLLATTPQFSSSAAIVFDRLRSNQVVLEAVDFDDPLRGGYFRRSRDFISVARPLAECLNGEDPIQVMFLGMCEPIRAVKRILEGLSFANEYTLARAEYESRQLSILDVLAPGVTKGSALAEWTRRRGIEPGEVMAIGDNWNDREMLEFAGFPVVMANGIEELKSMGWTVTLSNDQSGVAQAIRTYALGEKVRGPG